MTTATLVVTACEACGGDEFEHGVYGWLARCRDCGHIFYPQLPEASAEDVYTEDYFLRDEYCDYASQGDTLAKNFQRYLKRMARYGARGGRLFEVGCAYGFFLKEAASAFEVAGIDVTPEAAGLPRADLDRPHKQGAFLEVQVGPLKREQFPQTTAGFNRRDN